MDPKINPGNLTFLLQLLSQLRGLQWSHWNSHWKVKGDSQYGDHLLFERLYTSLSEEIDTLGEKITSYFGPTVITDLGTLLETTRFLSLHKHPDTGPTDLYERALDLESHLQRSIKRVYDKVKESGEMSLGLDDYLMSLANAHETAIYLLKQRLR